MNTITDRLASALRNLPNDDGMIEHNPDEGLRLFCCDGRVVCRMKGDDTVEHAAGCWYVAAREALAAYDAHCAQSATSVA